ncbi:MAG: hypothetical protein HY074_18375 [Deltaproteobacteria bacterium]|nr:hypothetical protein [Deltaproteobacteria bacterium]
MKASLLPVFAAVIFSLLAPAAFAQEKFASKNMTCTLLADVDLKKSVDIRVDDEADIDEAADLILDSDKSTYRLKVTLLNGDLDMSIENKRTNVVVSSSTDTRLTRHPKLFIKSGLEKLAAIASCWYDARKPASVKRAFKHSKHRHHHKPSHHKHRV